MTLTPPPTQYLVLLTVITEIIHQDYLCYQMFGTSGEHTVNENKGFFTLQVQSYTGIFTLYHKIIDVSHSNSSQFSSTPEVLFNVENSQQINYWHTGINSQFIPIMTLTLSQNTDGSKKNYLTIVRRRVDRASLWNVMMTLVGSRLLSCCSSRHLSKSKQCIN